MGLYYLPDYLPGLFMLFWVQEVLTFIEGWGGWGVGVESVVWLAFFFFFLSKENGYKENSSVIPWDQFTNC